MGGRGVLVGVSVREDAVNERTAAPNLINLISAQRRSHAIVAIFNRDTADGSIASPACSRRDLSGRVTSADHPPLPPLPWRRGVFHSVCGRCLKRNGPYRYQWLWQNIALEFPTSLLCLRHPSLAGDPVRAHQLGPLAHRFSCRGGVASRMRCYIREHPPPTVPPPNPRHHDSSMGHRHHHPRG